MATQAYIPAPVHTWPIPFISLVLYLPVTVPPQMTLSLPFPHLPILPMFLPYTFHNQLCTTLKAVPLHPMVCPMPLGSASPLRKVTWKAAAAAAWWWVFPACSAEASGGAGLDYWSSDTYLEALCSFMGWGGAGCDVNFPSYLCASLLLHVCAVKLFIPLLNNCVIGMPYKIRYFPSNVSLQTSIFQIS